ncbi:hypothetical protein SJI00_21285 [Pseudomonas sp. RP23018S]|uniref:hypothetical protein n=1 Tax=Pseudomonas sp. RP23018S TaxID=3096037 RepID=UPI002ACA139E|nr:hypothetical protein [Pseudomonas sp. RP23018S]MDZ5605312.1 hypothetical protein [Pseudomonas sp. RP23018S]
MIHSFKRYRKLYPTSIRTRFANLVACALAAPFVLVVLYTLIMAFIGGLWFLIGKLGNADLLMPYAFTCLTIAILYRGLDARRSRKLFTKYLAGQSKEELLKVALAPDGEYSKLDRRLAADAAHESTRLSQLAERSL